MVGYFTSSPLFTWRPLVTLRGAGIEAGLVLLAQGEDGPGVLHGQAAAGDGGGGALDGGVERAADIIVNEGGGSAGSLCVLMLVRKQDLVSPGCQDHLAGEVEACKVLGRSGVDPLVGLGLACKEVGGIAQEDHFIGGAFPRPRPGSSTPAARRWGSSRRPAQRRRRRRR